MTEYTLALEEMLYREYEFKNDQNDYTERKLGEAYCEFMRIRIKIFGT